MGLVFTLLYIIVAYVAPETVFGAYAQYHVETIIVALALVFSLPMAPGSGILRITQTWALVGVCVAVFFSILLGGWIGGAPQKVIAFLPDIMSFFLVALNCRSKVRLQALVVVLYCAAAFIVFKSQYAVHRNDMASPYLLVYQPTGDGATLIRIRGLSFLSDPNDLSQFMVSLIPCLFFFAGKGQTFRRCIVFLFAAFLIYGMFLTHSRGAMVALMVLTIVAGRRKIGVVPAMVVGGSLFAILMAAGFSGGRDVSAGEDRVGAWSAGLQLIRSHPLFGVGFERFPDFYEITAHNTVVVCAAEIGLIGFFFWVLFILITLRNAWAGSLEPVATNENELTESKKVPSLLEQKLSSIRSAQPGMMAAFNVRTQGALSYAGNVPNAMDPPLALSPRPPAGGIVEVPVVTDDEAAEIRRMSGLILISFAGFLTAGWFLSRAYTMVLYVNAGMGAAVYGIAVQRGIAPPTLPTGRALKLTAITCVVLLIILQLIVLVDHVKGK